METPPVILLAFNRPDLARKVLEAIRQARPTRLFIAVDGPRSHKPGESDLCSEVRNLTEEVDWPCELKTRFNESNQGCKHAVTGAINWFFEHVEEGIILEDDCLPHPSFFPFCAQMLERYRQDERVGIISGDNFRPQREWRDSGHEFSHFTFIWGWATWRRAWHHYDGEMTDWPELRKSGWLSRVFCWPEAVLHWTEVFDRCFSGKVDTWDYQWTYSCWKTGFLCVVPSCNLISNIGFDERATHTSDPGARNARLPIRGIKQPWDAISKPVRDRRQEKRYLRSVYGIRFFSWRKRTSRALRSWRSEFGDKLLWWTLPLASKRTRLRRTVKHLKQLARHIPGQIEIGGIYWSYPDSASFAYAYEQIHLCGIYDLGNSVGPAPRIVDCGANVGLATLYWKSLYPGARVTAVEADPAIHSYLIENLTRAGVMDVEALNRAVWNAHGEVWFASQGADAGCIVSAGTSGAIRVEAIPLAKILGKDQVDLLKMDIEGAECDVLIGAEAVLAGVRRIFVEYHSFNGRSQRLDELLTTLCRAGFRLQIHSELISERPFVKRIDDNGMDHRLNIFGWRV